ncbi:MAG: AraC family transcriptional regulator [Erysipelothrix sp.]|jgi:AraC-like DNA-binding protein|nr:AraC family transcriptional regulator [Erysipelothrix sp.]
MTNKKRQVQRKMTLTFVLSGVFLTGLLSYFTSRVIVSHLIEQSVKYATQSLDVAKVGTTTLLDDLVSEYYFLFNEQSIITNYKLGLNSNTAEVATLLRQTSLADPLVDDLVLFNVKNNEVILSNGQFGDVQTLESSSKVQSLRASLESLKLKPNRLLHYHFVNDRYVLAMTLVSYDALNAIDYVLMIQINEESLSSLFTGVNSNYEIAIVNEENIVIADSAQKLLGQPFPLDLTYTNPMSLNDKINYFLSRVNQEQSLVAFSKSIPYGVVFFHITPYASIETTINSVNQTIVLLFMGFVLLNILVSWYVTQRFYAPIKAMVDQYVKQDYDHAKNEYDLIESTLFDLKHHQNDQLLKQIFLTGHGQEDNDTSFLSFPGFVIVCLLNEGHKNSEVQDNFKSWIVMNDQTLATFKSEDELLTWSSHEDIGSYGVSQKIYSIEDVRQNYRYALAAAQYCETLEGVSFIHYDDIRKSEYLTPKTHLSQQINKYLEEFGYSKDFSIENLADSCGFSVGYVRQVFKEQTGIALNEYVISMRLEKAKEYLTNSSMSGKEISEAVGYSDSRYFYTQFKKRFNVTIENYRSMMKGK